MAVTNENMVSKDNFLGGDEVYVQGETTKTVPTATNVMGKSKQKLFCNECEISFSTSSNLTRHNKKRHKNVQKMFVKKKKPNDKLFCNECEISFANSSNLSKHNKNKHGKFPTKRFQCILCSELFTSKKLLLAHSTERHEIDFKTETKEFESEEDFTKWKEETEKRDMASFVIYSGTFQKRDGLSVTYYNCHRSGNYEGRGANKRRLKMCGTNKIGKRCPAGMKVTREPHRITVVYKSTHIGHTKDIYRLRLSKSERAALTSRRLADEVNGDDLETASRTDDDVKSTAEPRDLTNVAESYELHQSNVYDRNDEKSVDVLVEKLKRQFDTPVVFYKPFGVEEEMFGVTLPFDDFLLCIMNELQRTVLEHHGNETVYIESTRGMSPLKYRLTTLFVVNDSGGDSFPVAFLYSSRRDAQILQLFFISIKSRLTDGFSLEPKCFMSEDDTIYRNAWEIVFKPVRHPLICSWHVKTAWNQKLSSITREKRTVLEKQLDSCLYESDVVTFETRTNECLENWRRDEQTKEFADYFERRYFNRKTLWAYCYRTHLPYSTRNTTALENWQRDLNIDTDSRKQMTSRLDKSIHIVTAAVRNKMMSCLISIEADKLNNIVSVLERNHINSTFIAWENVLPVLEVDALKFWTVASSRTLDGDVCRGSGGGTAHYCYDVVVDDIDCKCDIKCSDCDLCIHALKCSCVDNTICHNMCKHIHLIGRNVQFKVVADCAAVAADAAVVADIDTNVESSETVTILTDEENKAQLMEMVQVVVSEIQNSWSTDEYQIIRDALSVIRPMLEAVRNATTDATISSTMWEEN